jgi:hypothetical protein
MYVSSGNAKGGSITVLLTTCLTGLDWSVLQIKTEIVSCHTADSKPVKQEINGSVILTLLVFPGYIHTYVCTHISSYIRTYKYTYIHTYIHTFI